MIDSIAAWAEETVLDVQGQSVPLGRLWATRPAVLIFLRHFA